jgi:serine/threonine protein kinase
MIADFGLSKKIQMPGEKGNNYVGTPPFIPPEVHLVR